MASSASKQSRRPAPANFLEALRDLSRDAASQASIQIQKAITEDIPQSFGFNQSGDLTPNQSFSLEDMRKAEKVGENRAENRFNNRLQEERLVFLRSENETKKQIQIIQQDILAFAKSAGDLAQQVQIATMQAPINPGVYQRNFFEHLRSMIKILRSNVESSRNWLAAQNSRATRRGSYWGSVKTSGTKFMLSQERYMVTTTG